MAHSCPECGSACYCCGDIDDIDFGEGNPGCTCCLGKDEFEDDHYLEDYGEAESDLERARR